MSKNSSALSIFNWQTLNQEKKEILRKKRALLILGSIDLSEARITNLAKKFTKKNFKVIWGCLDQDFIDGFMDCPQFRALQFIKLQKTLNTFPNISHFSILLYQQRDSKYVIRELKPRVVILVYDSWQKALHYTDIYYELIKKRIKYKLISPYNNLAEAKAYEQLLTPQIKEKFQLPHKKLSDQKLLACANIVAKQSYDHIFQTGAILARDQQILLTAYNRIVPFQTFARHFGSQKEINFAPPNDLNHYDTNHAEVEILIKAQEAKLDLTNTSLYVNLLPCPTCARMLSRTAIKRIVYEHDHSDGYAYKLLTTAGKKVERIVL